MEKVLHGVANPRLKNRTEQNTGHEAAIKIHRIELNNVSKGRRYLQITTSFCIGLSVRRSVG